MDEMGAQGLVPKHPSHGLGLFLGFAHLDLDFQVICIYKF